MSLQVGETAGQVCGRDPAQRGMPAKPAERGDHVRGETYAHRHVADRVLQDEVPANDPRDQLAHGGVGIGVSAAGNWNHGRQLGVAKPGKGADDGHQHQRDRQCRTRSGPAQRGCVMHEVVGYRGVQDGRGVEFLPGNRRPHHGEDAGADHGADAKPDQRPRAQRLLKPMFRLLRIGDQLVDGLAREDLVRQVTLPGVLELVPSNSNRKCRVRASQRRFTAETRRILNPAKYV